MHEMSIAASLVRELLGIVAERPGLRIVEVELHCGVMQQVVPEALRWAFEAASAGTPAQGARLKIVEQELAARCRGCGRDFAATIDNYQCPGCGRADVDLLAGRDIVLQSVVCET
jgi:hydrogenase nickel incorporation protein HypA/HybF